MPIDRRSPKGRSLLLAAAIALTPAAAGASPGHGDDADAGVGAAAIDRTMEIEAGDMRFMPGDIDVRPGETIRFVVTNTDSIEHEFAVDTPVQHREHREAMVTKMQQGASMAELMHDDATVVGLAPGETRELVLTIDDPAAVEMACNLPGHYESGMRGAIDPAARAPGS